MSRNDSYITIREMPKEERPRERLMKYGPEVLKTSELLAIIIRTGQKGVSALDLANRLLRQYVTLRKLAKSSVEELCKVEGIGMAKAVEIKAAFELGKRLAAFTENERPSIHSPTDVVTLLMSEMKELDQEHVKALLLNTKNQVLSVHTIAIGGLNRISLHPRECFKKAIAENSCSIIIVHNHPSGDPQPSQEDIAISEQLKSAGDILGIKVLDHIILGDGKYISLKEKGLI